MSQAPAESVLAPAHALSETVAQFVVGEQGRATVGVAVTTIVHPSGKKKR